MAVPNEVRVNIRRNVLVLKTFTVPQLQAITGLNRQSIHTEVRRMEQEGLVSRVGTEAGKKVAAGGRPSVVYRLTSDPEKRFGVLQWIRAFYITVEEKPSELRRPESKHYFIAKETLEEVLGKGSALTPEEKSAYLDQIRKRLEYARQEEEAGEEGTQLIAAIFAILEAKAVDALAGDWERAVELLGDARRECRQLGADDLVAEMEAYVVRTIASRIVEHQVYFDEIGMCEKVEEMACNMRIIEHRFGDLPEVLTFAKQVERLAAKALQERIRTIAEERAAQQNQALIAALKREQTILVAQVVPEIVEQHGRISEPGVELLSLHDKIRTPLSQTSSYQLSQGVEERSYRSQSSIRFAAVMLPRLVRIVQESES